MASPNSRWPVMLSVITGEEFSAEEEGEGLLSGVKGVDSSALANFDVYKSWGKIQEACSVLAKRLYYSRVTGFVYAVVLTANVYVLIRGIFFETIDVYLVAAECFVTLMLVLEVLLRMVMQGYSYFSHFANLFDLAVMIVCVVLLILSPDLWVDIDEGAGYAYTMEDAEDIIEQLLIATRFIIQILRTGTLAMRRSRSRPPEGCVDFTQIQQKSHDHEF